VRPALQAASDCFEVNGAMAAGDGDSSSLSSFGHLRPGVSHKGVEGSRFGFSAGAARLLYQAVINIDLKGERRRPVARGTAGTLGHQVRNPSRVAPFQTPTAGERGERERDLIQEGPPGGGVRGLGWVGRCARNQWGSIDPLRLEQWIGVWPLVIQSYRRQAPRVLREANGTHWHQGCQCPL